MGKYYQSYYKHWDEDDDFKPAYPEDLKIIREYLSEHGNLNCSDKKLDELYHEFSETMSAGWLIINDDILEEFEQWLDEQE